MGEDIERRRQRKAEEARRYRERHPDRAKASQLAYREKNGEAKRKYMREYAAKRRKTDRPWLTLRGRSERFPSVANIRARHFGVPGVLTMRDVLAIAGPCHYCGGEQHGWDHVLPLSKGGPNAVENLVPACWPCNRKKGSRL